VYNTKYSLPLAGFLRIQMGKKEQTQNKMARWGKSLFDAIKLRIRKSQNSQKVSSRNTARNKLYVQPNWNKNWQWPIKGMPPVFVGRTKYKERIKSFLTKDNNGSLFIGGDRGSGKTSTVLASLCESFDENRVIVVQAKYVFLSGSSNPATEKEDYILELIKTLARSLEYAWNWKFLFSRDFLSQYKVRGKIIQLKKDVNAKISTKREENIRENISKTSFALSLDGKIVPLIIAILLNGAWVFNKGNFTLPLLDENITSSVISLVNIFLLFSITLDTLRSRKEENIRETSNITVHELQDRVLEIIRILSKHRKVVILFEELDHYDEENVQPGPLQILNLLKTFKILLTTSNASFVFLIGKITYGKLKTPNTPYTTIATEKIFLPLVKPTDLDSYLDNIFLSVLNRKKEISK